VQVADEMAQPHGVGTWHNAMLCDAMTATGAPGQCMHGQLASRVCRTLCGWTLSITAGEIALTCEVVKPMDASVARDSSETWRRCHLESAEARWREAFESPL